MSCPRSDTVIYGHVNRSYLLTYLLTYLPVTGQLHTRPTTYNSLLTAIVISCNQGPTCLVTRHATTSLIEVSWLQAHACGTVCHLTYGRTWATSDLSAKCDRLVLEQKFSVQELVDHDALSLSVYLRLTLTYLLTTVLTFNGYITSSSAVAERTRDALCPSVVSINKIIPRAVSYYCYSGFRPLFDCCCSHQSVTSLSFCLCQCSLWTFWAHFVLFSWLNVLR